MPGPPEDVPASELFLKLQERPRPTEIVAFPRRTADGKPVGKIRIRVLTEQEEEEARRDGQRDAREQHKLTKEELETPIGHALVSDSCARQVLRRACVAVENRGSEAEPFYPFVFPDSKSIGALLSSDEVATLYSCWRLVQSKWGPSSKTIDSDEELSAWVRRLVEGAAEFPLQQLSLAQWASAASLLAGRAYTLSVILESLCPSLPPILRSRLEKYSLGTGFFGLLARRESAAGTETSLDLKVLDVEITTDEARMMTEAIRGREEEILRVLDEAEALGE